MRDSEVARDVVMVHGAGDSQQVWSAVGDEVMNGGVNWIALDLPGRNDVHDPHPGSIEGLADWAAERITELDLLDIVLVGHSMGSLVALEVACRIPERLARLVLLCTGTPMVVSSTLLEPESTDSLVELITKWSHSPDAHRTNPDAIERHRSAYDVLRPDTFVLDLRSCHEYKGAVEASEKVDVPTTVVLAELDVMVRKGLEVSIIEALGTCSTVIIDGVGHAIADEAPIETAQIILDVATAP